MDDLNIGKIIKVVSYNNKCAKKDKGKTLDSYKY
tara:strand:- start:986 stop:1087 length:102 start_codon:yes stop_codon:yes gene_type:complete